MGRIFLGLCSVGAYGCFDEFNRLEEKIMSTVSQLIQQIQSCLKDKSTLCLINQNIDVNPDTGLFITMNPGYAGRTSLPDNLKKLFRPVAMTRPNRQIISQVMLLSQGFIEAESLSLQIDQFFDQCQAKLSNESHYDFGLRALKSVITSAGTKIRKSRLDAGSCNESLIIVQSINHSVSPKLVSCDSIHFQK